MGKSEAFTLIELLAVIVILAVIALIATPLILGIIEEVKEDSFKSGFKNMMGAVELDVSVMETNLPSVYTINEKQIKSFDGRNVNVKGKVFGNGKINISKEARLTGVLYYEDYKYCLIFDEEMKLSKKVEVDDCNLPTDLKNEVLQNVKERGTLKNPLLLEVDVDGLYKTEDSSFEYTHLYRGTDPENYIILENSCFRILNFGKDYSAKVVYFKTANADNTCSGDKRNPGIALFTWNEASGVNSWHDKINNSLRKDFEEWFLDTTKPLLKDKVIKLSSYFNDFTLDSNSKAKIKKHNFNVGGTYAYSSDPILPSSNLSEQILLEKTKGRYQDSSIYSGYVGLPNVSDHIGASSNSKCNVKDSFTFTIETGKRPCEQDYNYLVSNQPYWFMNSKEDGNIYVLTGHYTTFGTVYYTHSSHGNILVRPVFYLESDVKIIGDGKASSPYIIK